MYPFASIPIDQELSAQPSRRSLPIKRTHPYIVNLYDSESDTHTYTLLTSIITLLSLNKALNDHPKLSEEEVRRDRRLARKKCLESSGWLVDEVRLAERDNWAL